MKNYAQAIITLLYKVNSGETVIFETIKTNFFCKRSAIRRCIQKSQDNAHNAQVACSSRVYR